MPSSPAGSAYSGWIAVKLRFVSLVGPAGAPDQVEDRVLLLHTDSRDDALRRAMEIGAAHEHAYENGLGESVHVRFEGVVDVVDLFDAPGDGAEVWWEFPDAAALGEAQRGAPPLLRRHVRSS